MLEISAGEGGHFLTVGEALLSVPYGTSAVISIAPGVYREKLFVDKSDILLRGAGSDKTTIVWDDGGFQPHPDGHKKGTFRSYTLFLGGGRVAVENLTVANTAGDGRVAGQAIAAYVDAERAFFQNVRLLGRQDTLFCAPLPEAEREKRGFCGPRHLTPRKPSTQYYKNCYIEGDVDFIFGGADALFEDCEICSLDRGEDINGYVTAPSGSADGLGFVFYRCRFTSDCPPGTVYLGRPWRPYGKTALLNCAIDAHIHPEGWSRWKDGPDEAQFREYACDGPGSGTQNRAPWARRLSENDARELLSRAKAAAKKAA
ncbi:MAG: pectin esterase [Oscillospiraceae bacterium]|jgi:pectinesterase|nr:pectin esterase [Oscillospiraceae bacterium]